MIVHYNEYYSRKDLWKFNKLLKVVLFGLIRLKPQTLVVDILLSVIKKIYIFLSKLKFDDEILKLLLL